MIVTALAACVAVWALLVGRILFDPTDPTNHVGLEPLLAFVPFSGLLGLAWLQRRARPGLRLFAGTFAIGSILALGLVDRCNILVQYDRWTRRGMPARGSCFSTSPSEPLRPRRVGELDLFLPDVARVTAQADREYLVTWGPAEPVQTRCGTYADARVRPSRHEIPPDVYHCWRVSPLRGGMGESDCEDITWCIARGSVGQPSLDLDLLCESDDATCERIVENFVRPP